MFHKTRIAQAVFLALGAGNLVATTPAMAQQANQAAKVSSTANSDDTGTLEKVIVTAQFRAEEIQQVPVAVTAIDTKLAVEQGLRNFELFKFVPNAAAQNTDGEARPRIYIRGLGTGDVNASTVLPVGVYADGVYLNSPTAIGGGIFDLERVEVLRGPQGTLYGKNTTGGAINYISRKPQFTAPNGELTVGFGSAGQRTLEGAFGGLISGDWLAARVAFLYDKRDGFTNNLATGNKDGGVDNKAFRAQFLARISENLDGLLKLHYREIDGNGNNGSLPIGVYYPGTAAQYIKPDGRVYENSVPASQVVKNEGASLTLNQKLGAYLLTSITANDLITSNAFGGGGSAPYETEIRSKTDVQWRQTTQEFRLTSPKEDRLRWIAGYHYFQEHLTSDAVGARYQAALVNLPVGAPAAQSATNPAFRETAYQHNNTSNAFFGSVTYDVTEQFSLTGGLRWTEEKKDLDISLLQYNLANFNGGNFWNVSSLVNPGAPASNSGSRQRAATWKDWTWDLTPEYRFTDNLRSFLRVARGFRSGAFNVGIGADLNTVTTVKPEYLDSIEVGVKSEWLNGRLIANANVFHYNYTDIQTNLLTPIPGGGVVSALANGPKAKVDGAEFEINAKPIQNLLLRFSLALLDGKYTDFVNRNPVTGVISSDYSGNRLVRSPKTTSALGADYTFRFAGGSQLVAGGDLNYRSKEYFAVDRQTTADIPLSQSGFSLLNLRLTYSSPDKKVRITGYVNNATDKLYQVHGRVNGTGLGNYVITYGNPRTSGVSLTTVF